MKGFHVASGGGGGLEVSDDRSSVVRGSRDDEELEGGEGVVFSESPAEVGEISTVVVECGRLRGGDVDDVGVLSLGATTQDPGAASTGDLKDVVVADDGGGRRDRLWQKPVGCQFLREGDNRLTFCLTSSGELHLSVNNRPVGAHLSALPASSSSGQRPLWLFFVMRKGAAAIRIMKDDRDIPVEILSRGREASEAYERAAREDSVVVRRGRIFVVGPDRSGKSTLSNALIGQEAPSFPHSRPTECPSVGPTCRISKDGTWERMSWRELKSPSLEEDRLDHLALSTASSIVFSGGGGCNRRKSSAPAATTASSATTPTSRRESVSAKLFNKVFANRIRPSSLDNPPASSASFASVTPPEDVIPLVEEHLYRARREDGTMQDEDEDEEAEANRSVLVNCWDLGGRPDIGHIFMSEEPVYVLVFDLSADLEAKADDGKTSYLDRLVDWVGLIGQKVRREEGDRPSVVVAGTHRDRLHPVEVMQHSMANFKFERLLEELRKSDRGGEDVLGCGVDGLVSFPFFAVDLVNGGGGGLEPLKKRLFQLLACKVGPGARVPRHWLELEAVTSDLAERGVHFVTKTELANLMPPSSSRCLSDLDAVLRFYHSLGLVFNWAHQGHHPGPGSDLVVVSKSAIVKLASGISKLGLEGDCEDSFVSGDRLGVLAASADLTPSAAAHLLSALGLVSRDLSDEEDQLPKYFSPFSAVESSHDDLADAEDDELHVLFRCQDDRFPSECLFGLAAVDLASSNLEFSYEPGRLTLRLRHGHLARFSLLDRASSGGRLCLAVTRAPSVDEDVEEEFNPSPNPEVCLWSVRRVQSCLATACSKWFPRLHFRACCPCPCAAACEAHQMEGCREPGCLHTIDLSEAMSNSSLLCNFRKVDTRPVRKFFPSQPIPGETVAPTTGLLGGFCSQQPEKGELLLSPAELHSRMSAKRLKTAAPQSPKWLKGAVKLLENGGGGGHDGEDWRALAELLGYKPKKIEELDDTLQPAMWLFRDWLSSSGNTRLSVEMLCACLEDIKRRDVVEVIADAEREGDAADGEVSRPPQVFVSYHWDDQERVLLLRSALDRAGLTCWMDVGQVGGGDVLYERIYGGIRSCRVFLACVSPRYAVSDSCCKELSLADLLHKPVIPVMAERTPWPPPGPMALLLSQLVYVDLAGAGGHGGAGKNADWNAKVDDLVVRIRSYITVLQQDARPNILFSSSSGPQPPQYKHLMMRGGTISSDAPVEAAEVGGRGSSSASAGAAAAADASSSSSTSSSSSSSSSAATAAVAGNPLAWIAAASASGGYVGGGGGGGGGHYGHQHRQDWMESRIAGGGGNRCCGNAMSGSCQIL